MLRLRHLSIDSFGEQIAYINKNCMFYNVDNVNKPTNLEISSCGNKIYASLQMVDDSFILQEDEIGLNTEAFEALACGEGEDVEINLSPPPKSLEYIKRKISGDILSSKEYSEIMKDIMDGRYSKMDIAVFLVSCLSYSSSNELVSLIQSMVSNNKLNWDEYSIVVDSHTFGEVMGNSVDLIILAIISAYGLPIAKTCIGSTLSASSVADTIGVMTNIYQDDDKFQGYVRKNRGAIAYYDTLSISYINGYLRDVAEQLQIDKNEFIIISMLSMIYSTGLSHALIDIPVGKYTRVKDISEAIRIKKQIEYICKELGIFIEVVITDGSEPIGSGIGSVLEMRDVVRVLRNSKAAPQDLRDKSLFLAGRILEFDPNVSGGQGYAVAKELLEKGRAWLSFQKIILSQGRKKNFVLGQHKFEVIASVSGIINEINGLIINKICMIAGSTQCVGAGVDLYKKIGDEVVKGDILYTIYSCNSSDLEQATFLAKNDDGYTILNH